MKGRIAHMDAFDNPFGLLQAEAARLRQV